jgi:predicted ATPase
VSFTLHVENLRALRRVNWAPEGVCALVGPNGSGKSTLLQVLRFLALTATRRPEEAARQTFGSAYGLRNRSADDADEITIGFDSGGSTWATTLVTSGTSIEFSGFAESGDQPRVADLFKRFHVYHDPDLWSLRMQGSPMTGDSHIHSRGLNVFAVLRLWNERREHRHRQQFVLEGLRAAFPSVCGDLDFESAGQTTFVRLWAPGSELPTPIANEANGVLAMLVYLCNIASGEPGGLVAIDEPENSLHPHAIRELLAAANAWSEAYDTTIVLATHSPVILNELTGSPERVWVMRQDAGDEPDPKRLDQLKNPDWLRNFALGTLYASGELGSNDDAAA